MTPAIGDIYKLAEADYQFGEGALLVKILEVVRETRYRGEPWYEIRALTKPPDAAGQGQERSLYIRAASLLTTKVIPSNP